MPCIYLVLVLQTIVKIMVEQLSKSFSKNYKEVFGEERQQ